MDIRSSSLSHSKQLIINHQTNAINAARQGAARTALIQCLYERTLSAEPLGPQSDNTLRNVVYIVENKGVVLKKCHLREREEERCLSSLFDFIPNAGVIPSLFFRTLNLKKMLPEIDFERTEHGILLKNTHPDLRNAIYNQSRSKNPRLQETANFINTRLLGRTHDFYLTPNLSNDLKQRYEMLEKCSWQYQSGSDGSWKEIAFKELHLLYVQKVLTGDTRLKTIGLEAALKDHPFLTEIFDSSWNLASPIMLRQTKKAVLKEVKNILCKSYQPDLYSLMTLNNWGVADQVLARLTPHAKFNAIRAAEYQMLDLTDKNISFRPVRTDEFCQFGLDLFTYNSEQNRSLNELRLDYLKGHITNETEIEYSGVKICLKDNSQLRACLDGPWELVLFDFDLAVTEDNELQNQTYGSVLSTIIPFRSDLLGCQWKDEPFDDHTLDLIGKLAEADKTIEQWAKRWDAPIRFFIMKEQYPRLDALIQDLIVQAEYTLSVAKHSFAPSFEKLKTKFVKNCSMLNQKTEKIWTWLQSVLGGNSQKKWFKPYQAVAGDTWESIAKFAKLSVSELKTLNQSTSPYPNGQITIKAALTGAGEASKLHREKIAGQLWKRMSWKQIQALSERQQKRIDYLRDYDQIKRLSNTDINLLATLRSYIIQKVNPLTYLEKRRLLQVNDADYVLQELTRLCQPSYFNFLKVYYPLLGDNYELDVLLYQDSQSAGTDIGHYACPLEELIREAKTCPPASDAYQLGLYLKQRLETKAKAPFTKAAAFFGHWAKEERKSSSFSANAWS